MSLAIVPYSGGAVDTPGALQSPASSSMGRRRVGLLNQGATCYMNSLLQSLFMCPEFRRVLYLWQYDPAKDDAEEDCIPLQLQRLFGLLQLSTDRAISTKALTDSFGWSGSDAFQQHDVQELARVLFDTLEKSLAGTPNGNIVQNLFRGMITDFLQCKECHRERARDDAILDLSLTLRPFGSDKSMASVEEALADFVKPEVLDGSNCVTCEQCGTKTPHVKGLKLKEPPYLLQIQLKRFVFDYETLNRVKVNDRVTFPILLDLNRFADGDGMAASAEPAPEVAVADKAIDGAIATDSFMNDSFSSGGDEGIPPLVRVEDEPTVLDPALFSALGDEDAPVPALAAAVAAPSVPAPPAARPLLELAQEMLSSRGPHVYELYAVLVHSGSAMGGHYYAYMRDLDAPALSTAGEGWHCFNDSSVQPASLAEVLATAGGSHSTGSYSYTSSANAYMLMYRRVLRTPHVEIRGGRDRAASAASAPAQGSEDGSSHLSESLAQLDVSGSAGTGGAHSAGFSRRERSASGSLYASSLISMLRGFPTDAEVPAGVLEAIRKQEEEEREREAARAEAALRMTVTVYCGGVSRKLAIKKTSTVAEATEAAWRLFHLDGTAPTPRGKPAPRASPTSSLGRDTDAGITALFGDSEDDPFSDSKDDDWSKADVAPLPPMAPVPLGCVRLREYLAAHDLPKAPLSYNPRPVPAPAVRGVQDAAVASYEFAAFVGCATSAGSGDAVAGEAGAASMVTDGWPDSDLPSSEPAEQQHDSQPRTAPTALAPPAEAEGVPLVAFEDGSQRTLDSAKIFSWTDLMLETRPSPDAP